MRFIHASLLSTLALLVPLAAAAQAQPQQPPPSVPPGYEGQPPGYGQPAQEQPPPPPGWGAGQPAPAQGATYPPSGGAAYPPPASPAPPPEPEGPLHSVSITLSPVHLVFPVVEVTGEFRLGDRLGLAGILGGGSITVADGLSAEQTFSVFEIGGQFLFYPVGDFDHGMQLGLEVLYTYVSGDFDDGSVTGTASGISVGPLIGYKFAASFGLTVDLQGGVAVAGIAARATDGTTTEEASEVHVGPLINLNAGWSF